MPKKATGRPNGRTPYKPNDEHRETVMMMAAIGIPQLNIARCIGIDLKTMTKYYRDELDTAADTTNAAVGGAMYAKAVGGDVSAQKYWLGCRAGWKETSVQENTGEQIHTIRWEGIE